jgi:hypothetical protein
MSRLQRKCIVASAGFHLLLVFLLLFGSGFNSPQGKVSGPAPGIELVALPSIEPIATGMLQPPDTGRVKATSFPVQNPSEMARPQIHDDVRVEPNQRTQARMATHYYDSDRSQTGYVLDRTSAFDSRPALGT